MAVAHAGVLVLQLMYGLSAGSKLIAPFLSFVLVLALVGSYLLELKEVAIFKDRFRKFLLARS